MVHTLELTRTAVKSTYTPPNPKPLLPDQEPPTKPSETEPSPSETEEASEPSETEETSESE